jgi:hypothetical protein
VRLLNRENSANLEVPEPINNEKHMIKRLSRIFLRGNMMNIFVKCEQIWDLAQSAVNEIFSYLLLKCTVFIFQIFNDLVESLELRFTLDAEPECAFSVLKQPIMQVICLLHM